MGQRADGTVFFLVDSLEETHVDYASPGLVYDEVSKEYLNAFHLQKELVAGPVVDRWGKLVTALIPIINSDTGNLVAMLGMDIDAGDWTAEIIQKCIVPFIFMVLFAMMIFLIISRKISTHALKIGEEKHRLFFENSPIGIIHYSGDGIITDVNDAMVETFGSSREKLIGLNINDIPDKKFARAVYKSLEGETGFFEGEYTSYTGRKKAYIKARWIPIFADNGRIDTGVGLVEDISVSKKSQLDLKNALKDLQLQKKEISALLEASQAIPQCRSFEEAARMIFDICKEIIGAKSGYVALLSDDGGENEVLFLDAGGLPCTVDPELPMPIRGLREVAYRTKETVYDNHFSDSKWMQFMPEGHVALDNVLFAPLNIQNQTLGIMGIANKPDGFDERDMQIASAFGDLAAIALQYARNQEALRDNEMFLETIIENIPNMLFVKDADSLRFIRFNKAGEALLGYARNDMIGKNDYDFFPKNEADFFTRKDKEVLKKGVLIDIPEESIQTRHKGERTLHTKKIPILDENGRPLYLLGISEDITHRKIFESQVRQSQKMESIGNLAGGIAHDFNNILFPILGMSELLLEDLPEESLEYKNVQQIMKAGQRGADLVRQILDIGRQSKHKMLPIQIQNILKEVLKLSRSTIPTDIRITENIDGSIGLVHADPVQMHQVAMNLITNAYHAMENHGGEICVTFTKQTLAQDTLTTPLLAPGDYAVLSIADNGHGIPAEIQNKIFEPYFTTKKKDKGTGLGLATVYGILKEHGGDIEVESEIGKGTTFQVFLPLMEEILESKQVQPESLLPTGTENILLVDDEQVIVEMVSQMLERLGYTVTTYTSSIDALAAFETDPDLFDLVITDMTMPNMTGDRLAGELINIKPDLPVIICTGFSERINHDMARQIGITGFLMKPVVKSKLARMIRDGLDEQTSDRLPLSSH